jgi:hypothetical protein
VTRVLLPNHHISHAIAKQLLIDYYLPRYNVDQETLEAQRRICDYIVEFIEAPVECAPSKKTIYLTFSAGTLANLLLQNKKVFSNVNDLVDYLNNS